MTSEASADRAGQNTRRSRRRLVALAIAGAGLLALTMLVALRRNPWFFDRGLEYHAAFRSVAGLRSGDKVRYAGLEVGSVTSIVVDTGHPVRLVVSFRVRDDIPVRADTRASIPEITIPVARYLILLPGSHGAPTLPPGSTVSSEESPSVQEALTRLTRILDRTDTLLEASRPVMERDFFGRLDRTMAHADTLLRLASRSSARLLPQVEEVTRRANTMLARTDRVLAALDSSHADLAAAPREALTVLRDTRALLTEIRNGVSSQGGLAELVQDLATAGDNLARLSAQLERDPVSALQRRRPLDKTAGPKP